MNETYSVAEIFIGMIGVLLSISFGMWATVLRRSASEMKESVDRAIDEIAKLREELHHDRLLNERRFSRLERVFPVPGLDDPR